MLTQTQQGAKKTGHLALCLGLCGDCRWGGREGRPTQKESAKKKGRAAPRSFLFLPRRQYVGCTQLGLVATAGAWVDGSCNSAFKTRIPQRSKKRKNAKKMKIVSVVRFLPSPFQMPSFRKLGEGVLIFDFDLRSTLSGGQVLHGACP